MPETAPTLRSHVEVAGHALKPLAAGALYWEAEDTLLVADLHLEKGAAFAALGMLLPPYDTRSTLSRLGKIIAHVDPARVVALGDSFHRSECADNLVAEDLAMLTKLQRAATGIGSAAITIRICPTALAAPSAPRSPCPGVTLRHEPSEAPSGPEIVGHLHPIARIARRGTVIRRRCFATDGKRLVMPAFGAYAGGLNVLHEAFRPLFLRHQLEAWMMGRHAVYPVLGSLLLPD